MWDTAVALATADGPVVQVAGWVATVGAGVAALTWMVRGVVRWLKRVDDFMDLVRGVPDRPGFPGRPGVFARMDAHDQQLTQIAAGVDALRAELTTHAADRMVHAINGAAAARRRTNNRR